MIATALLLSMIGIADLVRALVRDGAVATPPSGSRRAGGPLRLPMVAWVAATWAIELTAFVWFLGLAWWWAMACTILASAWLACTTSRENAPAVFRLWPAVVVLAATVVFMVTETGAPHSTAPVAEWLSASAPTWIRGYPPQQLAMILAVGLFMMESSNIVVRSALYPGTLHPRTSSAASVRPLPDLRGGRLIGPMERLGLVALTLAGMFTIVAALIAAKGIVRFPEISNDGATGSKAEYFLVGSLFSWALAMVGMALIKISGQTT